MTAPAGATAAPLRLVSHRLCPYVQRVATVLHELQVPFERIDIDLSRKPAWFLEANPLGRTPVLLVGDQALFESAVICEYLEEVHGPGLHPGEALGRARLRSWVEFASTLLQDIAALYGAADDARLAACEQRLRQRFAQLEAAFGDGPWFGGPAFTMVDAAAAPVFRYLDAFDAVPGLALLDGLPRLQAWRRALATRPSVQQAAPAGYAGGLREFLQARGSALSRRLAA